MHRFQYKFSIHDITLLCIFVLMNNFGSSALCIPASPNLLESAIVVAEANIDSFDTNDSSPTSIFFNGVTLFLAVTALFTLTSYIWQTTIDLTLLGEDLFSTSSNSSNTASTATPITQTIYYMNSDGYADTINFTLSSSPSNNTEFSIRPLQDEQMINISAFDQPSFSIIDFLNTALDITIDDVFYPLVCGAVIFFRTIDYFWKACDLSKGVIVSRDFLFCGVFSITCDETFVKFLVDYACKLKNLNLSSSEAYWAMSKCLDQEALIFWDPTLENFNIYFYRLTDANATTNPLAKWGLPRCWALSADFVQELVTNNLLSFSKNQNYEVVTHRVYKDLITQEIILEKDFLQALSAGAKHQLSQKILIDQFSTNDTNPLFICGWRTDSTIFLDLKSFSNF